ncbi:cytochrome b5 domain-containing protein [Sinanaerobacter chloroacetimidivorans]|jgi:membrane-associated progesterone receptor component|uniref:Cytochrome b5 heme-binding domain-containing protein n=1 Tax=Sinanaerobacter chloroacetimidivorans TaxID=2818044 RepID=A0A8J8B3Y5_9FIRM|nr:cytochrome b5 domain-containing protein [Sinanaerobacter chloroacetimidivorans]MBR0600202.1 hypothetical protein [Sinanaerobacter chloroacetimidivorans]
MQSTLLEQKLAFLIERNQMMEFTLEELAEYDGMEGRKAYVAINGVVYDVTDEPTWADGKHFGMTAGKDLTDLYRSCHFWDAIIQKLTVVGRLVV